MYESSLNDMDQYKRELIHRLDEARSEADHRVLGGFKTEDQKFALAMRELLREILAFMDDWERMVKSHIGQQNDEIAAHIASIARYDETLDEIERWVARERSLRRITDIINSRHS